MKIKIKYKMTYEQADRLIERYYEGLTSVEEERQLQAFLLQSNLPDRYEAEKAIFGYLKPQPKKTHFNLRSYMRWASVAAVLLAGVFSIQLFVTEAHASYAYIDGRKITNLKEIKLHAMASIESLPSGQQLVEQNLNTVSNKDIIQSQLDVFATEE